VNHVSFESWFHPFLSYRVNLEQRVQHRLLVQTLKNLQSSPHGCLGFVASDGESGERHHLTCESVPPHTRLLLKYPLCVQIVFHAMAVSVWESDNTVKPG
jgi:hypothetical protein